MECINQLSATVFERNQRFQSSCPSPALIGCGWSAVKNLWARNSDPHWDSTKGCWNYWQSVVVSGADEGNSRSNYEKCVFILKISTNFHMWECDLFSKEYSLNQYFMSVLKPVIYQRLPADWLKVFALVTGDLYGWLIPERQREPGLAH